MEPLRISTLIEHFQLNRFNPSVNIDHMYVTESDVNRLALQLTGFFDYFQETRVQIIGRVESSYLDTVNARDKSAVYEKLCSYNIPCIIFTRDIKPDDELLELATMHNIPILGTGRATSAFLVEIINYLNEHFAPSITVHGVLVDIYGEGVLITGESGIGKSEAALELVRRGHRLVADDAVTIKRINDTTLVGSAPSITKYLLEVRGIGIIDVKMLFGAESVLESQNIDLVIELTEWDGTKEYDRIGLEDEYKEYLGNKVVYQLLPIRPGRNTAAICEVAAVNHRQKKMGYNAAEELYRRVQENIDKE
ncbi:MAG: HPr(Ser) kinase/phosphatase [Lachnospiraceae bacterium]|nr:HPr(Ser) kinase/phosphatase [Lachnospiraceae bacterium]